MAVGGGRVAGSVTRIISNAFSPNAPKCGWLMAMFCFVSITAAVTYFSLFIVGLACLGVFVGMGYCAARLAACRHIQTFTHLKRTYATDLFRDSEFLDMQ